MDDPVDRPPTPPGDEAAVAVLVPVKAFAEAKVRLAPRLDPAARAALARTMAARVVAAAAPLPVWVVCDDDEVAEWARAAGATVSWQPRRGLNEAVWSAALERSEAGARRIVVAHADLPRAESLVWLAHHPAEAVLVPDRHDDGTNVMALPAPPPFAFAYGPGSFRRHLAAAEEAGLDVAVVRDAALGWDVDVPDDLEAAAGLSTIR